MFPNPQDALPLPPRPSLAQYKKLAKDLLRIAKFGDINQPGVQAALAAWSSRYVANLIELSGLIVTPGLLVRENHWSAQVADFARRALTNKSGKPTVLADAQFVLARIHGFASWPKFARHLDELAHTNSATAAFEAAADALVEGDLETLRRLLRENPQLIRARSSREHHATLLHYVAANGVEGYRQRTPKNIVEIAAILLDNGAEIDAAAEMYGGDCTTLGLAATSIHPERAGVQIPLLQLLLERGARTDRDNSAGNRQSLIKACLANGRGEAAKFLGALGESLDLEEAAGAGRLDLVESSFNEDRTLKPLATAEQLRGGFLWACQFGRNGVVEFLFDRGIDIAAQDRHGQTALHHAVIGAQLETVKLLLKHNAPLELKNTYGGTALGQALWSAYNSDSPSPYIPIIEELLAAGAIVEADIEDDFVRLLKRRDDGLAHR